MLHVMFFEPRIAGNTGTAIRLSAATGATLHLVEPLGFDLSEPKLRRAGLDYHDLAHVVVHRDLEAALETVPDQRVLAFTAQSGDHFADVAYRADDVLLFGPEPSGLPEDVLIHPRVTARLRIPMLPGRRSLNLATSAAIGTYEAWRQLGYPGAT